MSSVDRLGQKISIDSIPAIQCKRLREISIQKTGKRVDAAEFITAKKFLDNLPLLQELSAPQFKDKTVDEILETDPEMRKNLDVLVDIFDSMNSIYDEIKASTIKNDLEAFVSKINDSIASDPGLDKAKNPLTYLLSKALGETEEIEDSIQIPGRLATKFIDQDITIAGQPVHVQLAFSMLNDPSDGPVHGMFTITHLGEDSSPPLINWTFNLSFDEENKRLKLDYNDNYVVNSRIEAEKKSVHLSYTDQDKLVENFAVMISSDLRADDVF